MKKSGAQLSLQLEPTTDILRALSQREPHPVLIGFAAETENLIPNAIAKRRAKKLDLIIANDVSQPDAGFGVDTNCVSLIGTDDQVEELPGMPKTELAEIICDRVARLCRERYGDPPHD